MIRKFNEYNKKYIIKNDNIFISDDLKYHINEDLDLSNNIFRFGSDSYLNLISEVRKLYNNGDIILSEFNEDIINSDFGNLDKFDGNDVFLDVPMLYESEYKGKEVKLNKPLRNTGSGKKYYVYVKDPKTNKVKKISFGDIKGGLTAKISNADARKNFSSRHNCKDKKDKTKAGYWSCRLTKFGHLFNGKTYNGYW